MFFNTFQRNNTTNIKSFNLFLFKLLMSIKIYFFLSKHTPNFQFNNGAGIINTKSLNDVPTYNIFYFLCATVVKIQCTRV